MYKLFLDDVRVPDQVTWVNLPVGPWIIVRSYNEFVDYISKNGLPSFIAFDHDLSLEDQNKHPITGKFVEKTGYDCAKWLIEYCLDNKKMFPDYEVHSMNSIGKINLKSLIENFKHTIK